jgi:hypothetical protein
MNASISLSHEKENEGFFHYPDPWFLMPHSHPALGSGSRSSSSVRPWEKGRRPSERSEALLCANSVEAELMLRDSVGRLTG